MSSEFTDETEPDLDLPDLFLIGMDLMTLAGVVDVKGGGRLDT